MQQKTAVYTGFKRTSRQNDYAKFYVTLPSNYLNGNANFQCLDN